MALLTTHDLTSFYGDFQALSEVSTEISEGETVAMIGANGAGKSTYLAAIAGLQTTESDMIRFDGKSIGGKRPAEILELGISLVPEGRRLFPSLTVEENILVGSYGRKVRGPWRLESVYRLFPVLRERRLQGATTLSGGQQQMVAIGRALMSNPRLLLCDEISLGLAPTVIRDIYTALINIRSQGTSVIVVEQNITQALEVADRVYCLLEGQVTLEGTPATLTRERIRAAYFGN